MELTDFHILHHMCSHSSPESNTAYQVLSSSLRSGNFKTQYSLAAGLGKNVHVISQTVRTCMQISCTHEAPFSSLLSRNGSASCLPRQDILGLKVDGMIRLRHTGRSTAPCALETACVRARTQLSTQTIVPSRSHRHDVPEVEFKKKTPIPATLWDFSKACPAWD